MVINDWTFSGVRALVDIWSRSDRFYTGQYSKRVQECHWFHLKKILIFKNKLSQLYSILSFSLSNIKDAMFVSSPCPCPPFRAPGWSLTTNSVTTNIHHWMSDKTQIRGYRGDTAADNESYLHTLAVVTRGMIRDSWQRAMWADWAVLTQPEDQ